MIFHTVTLCGSSLGKKRNFFVQVLLILPLHFQPYLCSCWLDIFSVIILRRAAFFVVLAPPRFANGPPIVCENPSGFETILADHIYEKGKKTKPPDGLSAQSNRNGRPKTIRFLQSSS